mmetsp:Transcript_45318/g.92549  ORF Transcript_45318/g.92549 Transcript_45318/m.92549 type:complete len:220 (-) Transcript_45318:5919-6578(-)
MRTDMDVGSSTSTPHPSAVNVTVAPPAQGASIGETPIAGNRNSYSNGTEIPSPSMKAARAPPAPSSGAKKENMCNVPWRRTSVITPGTNSEPCWNCTTQKDDALKQNVSGTFITNAVTSTVAALSRSSARGLSDCTNGSMLLMKGSVKDTVSLPFCNSTTAAISPVIGALSTGIAICTVASEHLLSRQLNERAVTEGIVNDTREELNCMETFAPLTRDA